MKKLLIILSVFFTFQLNAQWYSQYNVTNMNELTEPQLNLALAQSQKTITKGGVLTVFGVISTIAGGIIYSKGLKDIVENDISEIDKGINKAAVGGIVLTGGCVLLGVGIPVWIVGSSRRNTINVHLVKFKETSYIPSIGIRITF